VVVKDMLAMVGGIYIPGSVVIRVDPGRLPRELGEVNGTVGALIEGGQADLAAMRICEGGVCGLPITGIEEARVALAGQV
jgi:hypothetical protein